MWIVHWIEIKRTLFTVLNVTWVVYEKIALQNDYSEEEEEKKSCVFKELVYVQYKRIQKIRMK